MSIFSFADRVGAGGIKAVSYPLDQLNDGFDNVLRQLRTQIADRKPPEEKIEFPTIKGTIEKVYNWLSYYHGQVMDFSIKKSDHAKEITHSLVRIPLIIISWSDTGKEFRNFVSNQLASLARMVTLGALQVLHALPYLVAAAVITGSVLLAQANPVVFAILVVGAVISYVLVIGVKLMQQNMNDNATLLAQMGEQQVQQLIKALELDEEKSKVLTQSLANVVAELNEENCQKLAQILNNALNLTDDQIAKMKDILASALARGAIETSLSPFQAIGRIFSRSADPATS